MFFAQEVTLDLGFRVARARLLILAAGDWLRPASGEAFAEGRAEMVRVAPFRGIPGSSQLARVRFIPPEPRDHITALPMRWEVAGDTGGLFPLLDADIVLLPVGERTRLVVSGSFRLPLPWFSAALDNLVLRQVAATTAGALLRKIAQQLCAEAQPAGGRSPPSPPSENCDRRPENGS